jgi:hypothetical protein
MARHCKPKREMELQADCMAGTMVASMVRYKLWGYGQRSRFGAGGGIRARLVGRHPLVSLLVVAVIRRQMLQRSLRKL